MLNSKAIKFPVLVTAATQAVLDDPAWPRVLENWKQRVERVRVLIPASARVDDKHMVYVRQKGEVISLADVVAVVNQSIDQQHPQAVVCDPLVVFQSASLQMLAPAFIQAHNLGAAWVATGNALRIDGNGQGEALEEECLRWFCGGSNVWSVLAQYVDKAVPFTSAIWSGYLAGMVQRKVGEPRYFDITSQKAVGTAMPPVGDYDPTGFAYFATNTPTRSYRELVEAKAP
jgi:hypothetical protein